MANLKTGENYNITDTSFLFITFKVAYFDNAQLYDQKCEINKLFMVFTYTEL